MLPPSAILRTKHNPPRNLRFTLTRPRVDALLRGALDHRVTIVQASTGYGKSTALARLAQTDTPLFWYSASEGDSDPLQFLAHLIAAFRINLPALGEPTFAPNQDAEAQATAHALLNALNNALTAPSILVIDDYHLAASAQVHALLDHFLAFLPNDLHVIVSTRYTPSWEHLIVWRARGELFEIKRDALAFTREEIEALFRETYTLPLSPQEVETLRESTEGWPIALQLVWQEMRANSKRDVTTLLARGSGSLDTLFAYLTHDVLAQQSREVQEFVLQTCILRELTPRACQAVSPQRDARKMLTHLQERDLFVSALGDEHYRYHHLFHDFLREKLLRDHPDQVRDRHRLAAEFYRREGYSDEAIYHLLRAEEYGQAADLIEEVGESVLRSGRLETLAGWIDAIPPDHVATRPLLIFHLGELARLRSRFDDALAWYAQAERAWRAANDAAGIARALRGQALVYLDTVRPARAEDLLQEALRITDGLDDRVARARLLELIAENKLNMGKAEEAEQLRLQARTLREEGPSEDVLSVRVKLRTGKLDEARTILETWGRAERGTLHPPRAHRETLLILSLIYSMQGLADEAFKTAEEAIALGAQFHSPFISAVGQMRLGHAHQIRGDPSTGSGPSFRAAIQCYEAAIALGDQLAVRRTRAEAMWGLTRAFGFSGNLVSARRSADEGIEIGRNAGDAWITALVQLALGASQVLARRGREAIEILADALAAMRSCGDTFGSAAVRMWLALAHWQSHQRERALAHFDEALSVAAQHHYDYLFITRTLLGLPDARMIAPLLVEIRRRQTRQAGYAAHLLTSMGLSDVTLHPGYQLRIQTLGAFRVWRGQTEISAREWQRKKARQLLQLFVTQRARLLEREEIFELLWRDSPPESAARDFKVALNALNKTLEPERAADQEPAFIARVESAYGLRREADVWIDAEEFVQLIARAEKRTGDALIELYRRALESYQDDYLIDARYEDWASAERERLLALYLRAADRLAQEWLQRGEDAECLAVCERILARDRCWEQAYRKMIELYLRRGDTLQARRVYDRYSNALCEELDAEPSPAMKELSGEVNKVEGK